MPSIPSLSNSAPCVRHSNNVSHTSRNNLQITLYICSAGIRLRRRRRWHALAEQRQIWEFQLKMPRGLYLSHYRAQCAYRLMYGRCGMVWLWCNRINTYISLLPFFSLLFLLVSSRFSSISCFCYIAICYFSHSSLFRLNEFYNIVITLAVLLCTLHG